MAKRKLPEGWTEGSVQEFLSLTDEEAAIVEFRVRLTRAVREKRSERGITQTELAARMQSSQPRVARLEQGDASIEMMLRALLALGSSRKEIGKLFAT